MPVPASHIGSGWNPRRVSFAESADGVLYLASGTGKVQRWRGFPDDLADAGLATPETAPVLTGNAGASVLTNPGEYEAYVSFVRDDGHESALSPAGTLTVSVNTASVDYSSVPVSDDSRVTARRIYRTTGLQARVAYLDVTIADNVTTTATSTNTDAQLQAASAFPLLTEDYLDTTQDQSPPPDYKPFLAWFQGRLWLGGEGVYTEGCVSVVSGSATVSGIGTAWTTALEGRYLHAAGASASFLIASVDTANQSLTLGETFAGVTDTFAAYAIRPGADAARGLNFSSASNAEHFPPRYVLEVPDDGDEVTGLMPMGAFMYVLKRRSMYRVTVQRDPVEDGAVYLASSRGCVNNHCWALMGEDALMLDEQGVHRFAVSQIDKDVSFPVLDICRGDSELRNINWAAREYFHAVHSPREYVVRFFVCMGGDRLPRHALAYQYGLDRWWVESYAAPVGASCRGQLGRVRAGAAELETVFLGGLGSAVSILGGSPLDGTTPDPRLRFTATAGGLLSVTAPGAMPDVSGASVAIVSGRGAGQRPNVVASVDGAVLNVRRPWFPVPDETSVIQVGGIAYRYETYQMMFAGAEVEGERSARLRFRPRPGERATVTYYYDHSAEGVRAGSRMDAGDANGVTAEVDDPGRVIDLGKKEGTVVVNFGGRREGNSDGPGAVRVAVDGVSGANPHALTGLVVKGVV